jgi:hypothetical protein
MAAYYGRQYYPLKFLKGYFYDGNKKNGNKIRFCSNNIGNMNGRTTTIWEGKVQQQL